MNNTDFFPQLLNNERMKARYTSNKKVYSILILWIFGIAWWIRYYQTYIGSPIPGGWGVNIDWTRHAIVQQGRIVSETDSLTVLSSYRGAQSYDWAAIALGITSILIGESLEKTLRILNAFPVVGFILYPSIMFILYRRISRDYSLLSPNGIVILSLSLFPSVRIIFKTSLGWYPEPYSTALLLLSLLLLPRMKQSKSHYLLGIILIITTFNMYHTWVFFFLLISLTILVSDYIFYRTILDEKTSLPGLLTIVGIGVLFFITGVTMSGRFSEIIRQLLSLIFIGGQEEFFSAANSELIGASASSAFEEVDVRRYLSLMNYGMTISIVALFGLARFYNIAKSGWANINNPNERLVIYSLLSFPVIIIIFFGMGGIGTAVGRTQYIGIYFAMFCGIILLSKEKGWRYFLSLLLIIGVVVTAVGGATLHSSTYSSSHTNAEAAAIEFTGHNAKDETPVFSGTRLGMPLLYFDQNAFVSIQVTNEGWEQRAQAIFYGNSRLTPTQAIRGSVEKGSITQSKFESTLVLFSKTMERNGPSLLSYSLPPSPGLIDRFNRNKNQNKVYSSRHVSLYSMDNIK